MGSILPIGKLFRIPKPSSPSYAQPIAAPTPAPNNNPNPPAGGDAGSDTPDPVPDPLEAREKNLENRSFGLSGLIGTSLHGLLNFADKLPQRKTLLGE